MTCTSSAICHLQRRRTTANPSMCPAAATDASSDPSRWFQTASARCYHEKGADLPTSWTASSRESEHQRACRGSTAHGRPRQCLRCTGLNRITSLIRVRDVRAMRSGESWITCAGLTSIPPCHKIGIHPLIPFLILLKGRLLLQMALGPRTAWFPTPVQEAFATFEEGLCSAGTSRRPHSAGTTRGTKALCAL